uniref:Photolyase/cryptochrome alpha/beta domain-containing protein n=1 Tax=Panagrellus redivivus TaxID=6233 RepID=A0A7E4VBK0_PANRE
MQRLVENANQNQCSIWFHFAKVATNLNVRDMVSAAARGAPVDVFTCLPSTARFDQKGQFESLSRGKTRMPSTLAYKSEDLQCSTERAARN